MVLSGISIRRLPFFRKKAVYVCSEQNGMGFTMHEMAAKNNIIFPSSSCGHDEKTPCAAGGFKFSGAFRKGEEPWENG